MASSSSPRFSWWESGRLADRIKVAVLMGGCSSERDVSLSTGRMIMSALNPEKYEVFPIDSALWTANETFLAGESLHSSVLSTESKACPALLPMKRIVDGLDGNSRPDVAVIALHGRFGEDGTVQGFLELIGIPYVGSGVLASALAMDKIMARKVLAYEGIPLPKGVEFRRPVETEEAAQKIWDSLGLPAVVKPSRQGSTIGLSIARTRAGIPATLELAFAHDDEVLVEEFIEGVEITGAVIGNDDDARVLPLVEIVPEGGFYDYYSKYTPGATDEIVPARIPEEQYRQAQDISLACHKVLGCRDMSRTDMIVRGEEIFVLEVNTIPGMTPTSLLPRAAQAAGLNFPDLIELLISYALQRRARS